VYKNKYLNNQPIGITVHIMHIHDMGYKWQSITTVIHAFSRFYGKLRRGNFVIKKTNKMKYMNSTKKIALITLMMFANACGLYAQIPSCVPKNGLVVYMPFNNNANDFSGNNNHGIPSNITYVNDRLGNINSAIYFNRDLGANVEIPNSASLNFGKGTYNFWILPVGNNCTFLTKINWDNGKNECYNVRFYTTNLYTSVNYGSNCTGGTGNAANSNKTLTVFDKKWHMVSLVYGDSQTLLYLDGKLEITSKMNTTRADSCPGNIQLGRRTAGDPQNYLGSMDDLGIWNRMLDSNEIKTLYNTGMDQWVTEKHGIYPGGKITLHNKTYSAPGTYFDSVSINAGGVCTRRMKYIISNVNVSKCFPLNNLVLYMPFTDSAKDESGQGNHGKAANVSYTTDRFGNQNKAFHFDNSKQSYIEIPNSASLNSGVGTYNVWFNTKGGGHRCLISKVNFTNPNNEVVHLVITSTDALGLVSYGNTSCKNGAWQNNVSKSINPNDSQWHMLTLVYGDSQSSIYFDGVLNNRIKTPRLRADSCAGNIQIGRHRSDGPRYFIGELDDISIWNRMLDSNEIKNLFGCFALGKKEINTHVFTIYPNPNQGSFMLNIADGSKCKLEITDLNGRLVYAQNEVADKSQVTLNTKAGMYFIKLINPSGQVLYSRLILE
jgi:Concanavalin A-like lectin/glucanases superfamily/Secretion system C-terminal sorting domain